MLVPLKESVIMRDFCSEIDIFKEIFHVLCVKIVSHFVRGFILEWVGQPILHLF